MKIVISAGHGLYVRGAQGPPPWGLDEVNEARRVTDEVANWLKLHGFDVTVYFDDVSTTQQQNLNWIVNHHNSHPSEGRLDVSIHFNAYQVTDGGRGTECLYITQDELAAKVAKVIAESSGLINRGAHKRSDLYFLNGTTGDQGAILIEVCFVDAAADVEAYQKHFDPICEAIAHAIGPVEVEVAEDVLHAIGKCSWFGGPDDMGVSASEGLAFIYDADTKPYIFLDEQPKGTTGLARRLDPDGPEYYLAMRWDYDQFSKDRLAGSEVALVRSPYTGKKILAHPADWGPHADTGRVADLSPSALKALGIETDDEVEVVYPYQEGRHDHQTKKPVAKAKPKHKA